MRRQRPRWERRVSKQVKMVYYGQLESKQGEEGIHVKGCTKKKNPSMSSNELNRVYMQEGGWP